MAWNNVIQWMDFPSLKQIHFVQSTMVKNYGPASSGLSNSTNITIFFLLLRSKVPQMDPKFLERNKLCWAVQYL